MITQKHHMPWTLPDPFKPFPTLSDHFQSKSHSADLFSDFIALDYLVADPFTKHRDCEVPSKFIN